MRSTNRLSTRTETSDRAWAAAPRGAAARIHAHLLAIGPSTVDEVMRDLDISHQTASASVNNLMRRGWVSDMGLRAMTRARREAIVWVAHRERLQTLREDRPTRRQLEQRIETALLCNDIDTMRAVLRGKAPTCTTLGNG